SSSTPTAAGERTVVVPSPARTTAKSTGLPPTSPAGSPSPSSTPSSPDALSCSCHTPSVSRSRFRCSSRATERLKGAPTSSWRLCARTLICVRVSSSRSSTSQSPST
ncbi:hypothetical protein LTR57_025766, partial [Friedmanniomyces endolithicus]